MGVMRVIIFDLDGTLIDSAPDICSAVNRMLAGQNLAPLSLMIVRSFIGNGIPRLVERVMAEAKIVFSKEKHAALTKEFTKDYFANPAELTRLYPDVRKTLEILQNQGFSMGICTNKAYGVTSRVLRQLQLEQYFTSVIGGDTLKVNKPDPAMLLASIRELGGGEAIFVGDSEVDEETAGAAKVDFILFEGGYLKGSPEAVKSVARFGQFSQLPSLVKKIARQGLSN
ncbi:Phosphoglycolate phosphatase [hydrothermal vent metagenome]|uniref:phosphoglycolate phosphatase n=1 Tax=hydrothermal vent metagenome TaxID=652676 RepID=A0A3B0U862_9ZZZZ